MTNNGASLCLSKDKTISGYVAATYIDQNDLSILFPLLYIWTQNSRPSVEEKVGHSCTSVV